MTQIILTKRSAVPGKIPTVGDLQLAELGINTYDGKLFLHKNNGTDSIVEVGAIPTNVALPGVPTTATAANNISTDQIATTAFVKNQKYSTQSLTKLKGALRTAQQSNLFTNAPYSSSEIGVAVGVAVGSVTLNQVTFTGFNTSNLAVGDTVDTGQTNLLPANTTIRSITAGVSGSITVTGTGITAAASGVVLYVTAPFIHMVNPTTVSQKTFSSVDTTGMSIGYLAVGVSRSTNQVFPNGSIITALTPSTNGIPNGSFTIDGTGANLGQGLVPLHITPTTAFTVGAVTSGQVTFSSVDTTKLTIGQLVMSNIPSLITYGSKISAITASTGGLPNGSFTIDVGTTAANAGTTLYVVTGSKVDPTAIRQVTYFGTNAPTTGAFTGTNNTITPASMGSFATGLVVLGTNVFNTAATNGVVVGMRAYGFGVPPNTTVTAVTANTNIKLSNNFILDSGVTQLNLTFVDPSKLPISLLGGFPYFESATSLYPATTFDTPTPGAPRRGMNVYEFYTDSPVVLMQSSITSVASFRIGMNNRYIGGALPKFRFNSTGGTATNIFIAIEGLKGTNKFRFEYDINLSFQNLIIRQPYSVWPSRGADLTRVAIHGDSYQLTGKSNSFIQNSMSPLIAIQTGWDVVPVVQGGTGWANPGTGTIFSSTHRMSSQDNCPDVDMVIAFGSVNDSAQPVANITEGVTSWLTSIRAKYPNVLIVLFGCPANSNAAPIATALAMDNAISLGYSNWKTTTSDINSVFFSVANDPQGAWLDEIKRGVIPNGYTCEDTTHPESIAYPNGMQYLASRVIDSISKHLNTLI